jgi:hypothetical protein
MNQPQGLFSFGARAVSQFVALPVHAKRPSSLRECALTQGFPFSGDKKKSLLPAGERLLFRYLK